LVFPLFQSFGPIPITLDFVFHLFFLDFPVLSRSPLRFLSLNAFSPALVIRVAHPLPNTRDFTLTYFRCALFQSHSYTPFFERRSFFVFLDGFPQSLVLPASFATPLLDNYFRPHPPLFVDPFGPVNSPPPCADASPLSQFCGFCFPFPYFYVGDRMVTIIIFLLFLVFFLSMIVPPSTFRPFLYQTPDFPSFAFTGALFSHFTKPSLRSFDACVKFHGPPSCAPY